jgi:RecJ-like exonuclease
MDIKTKFNLGQRVYVLSLSNGERWVKCKSCEGNGTIIHNETVFLCTKCDGDGEKHEYYGKEWKLEYEEAKIGKIQVELYRQTFINQGKGINSIIYMLDPSGVGSGYTWKEEDLFATLEEACAEAERRNKEIEKYNS